MKPIVSIPTWEKLMKTFEEFMQLRPWLQLEAKQLFGFCDPKTGKQYFGSVLGSENLVTGFYIFPKEEALLDFFNIFENDQIDASLRQHSITFTLGSQDHLFDEEYDLYQAQHYEFAKGKYFIFRFFEKGYAPYVIDEEQAEVLLLGFETIKRMLAQAGEDKQLKTLLDNAYDTLEIPNYFLNNQAWVYEVKSLANLKRVQVSPSMPPVSNKITNSLHDGTWEVGAFYFPAAIDSIHPHRMVYPKVMVVADIEENKILTMFTSKENEGDEKFLKSLFELLELTAKIPSGIFTRGEDAKVLLQNFEEATGIEIIDNITPVSLVERIWSGFVDFSKKDQDFFA